MSKKSYSSNIYGIDIETSTIPSNVFKDKYVSYIVSFCVGLLNFEDGKYKDVYLGRTYEDLDNYLFRLNNIAKKEKRNIIIYIHNFSYEYSFFCNNLEFFKSYPTTLENTKDYMFLSPNKPLVIKCDKLEFRCSYLLLNKSIETIGKEINLEKLDFEYDKIRTPLTLLKYEEIKYNYRDVEIMLKGVYQLFKNNQYINNVADIPLTKTGITRLNSKRNPNINTSYINNKGSKKRELQNDKFICNKEKAKTETQLRVWENCFQGGLVFSNPYYCNLVVKNVASFDFSSSYPTQMLYRYFPYDFEEVTENKKEVLLKILDETQDFDFLLIEKLFATKYFNVVIKIKNINAKYKFYPLSTAKILNYEVLKNGVNCTFINGKIIECTATVCLCLTCIDFHILKCLYDFEIDTVEYLEVTGKKRKSTHYRLNCVVYNGEKKLEYKNYHNTVENKGFYYKYNENEIKDDYYRESINRCSDYVEQLSVAKSLYLSPKADLNAQYGDNAQHLIHERCYYDFNILDFKDNKETFEEYSKTIQKTSYIYGCYIVAYARASLCYVALQNLKAGIEILYTDTDSLKMIDNRKSDKIMIEYNKKIDYLIDEKYHYLKFGYLDKETNAEPYKYFCTLGTKSYLYLKSDNVVHATISGVPNATELYTKLYHHYHDDFYDLIDNCYHYNTIIDKSAIKKLAHTYIYFKEHIEVDNYIDDVYTGCVLKDTSITMKSFESKIWCGYSEFLKTSFGIPAYLFSYETIIKIVDGNIKVISKEI